MIHDGTWPIGSPSSSRPLARAAASSTGTTSGNSNSGSSVCGERSCAVIAP